MRNLKRLRYILPVFTALVFYFTEPTSWLGRAARAAQAAHFSGSRVLDVFFLPTGQGWILTWENGRNVLLRTRDNSRWLQLPQDHHLMSVSFVDDTHGWAVDETSDGFGLLVSADGGENWALVRCLNQIPANQTTTIKILPTSRTQALILAAEPGGMSLVYRVEQQGKTVTEIADLSDKYGIARAIFASPDGQNLWAIGNDTILHSLDSGKSWFAQVTHSTLPAGRRAAFFAVGWAFDGGRVFVLGQSAGGIVLRSDNFGATWRLVGESKRTNGLTDVAFWDEQHGCAVGLSRLLYCTSDYGDSWQEVSEIPKAQVEPQLFGGRFQRLAFANGGKSAWALEDNGALFISKDVGHTWALFDAAKMDVVRPKDPQDD